MARLTREQGLALLFSLTPEERKYRGRRAAEIFEAGGTLGEMLRLPLEEIAAARAAPGGAE